MRLPGFTAGATLRDAATQHRPAGTPALPQAGQVVAQFCFRRGITLCCTDPVLGVVCKVHWSVQAPSQ
jgi:hypothetical protein